MDITQLPFNSHVGIMRASKKDCLLMLSTRDCLKNHLGTIHASALFALAEATSGEFLIRSRGNRTEIGGVVRRNSSKYSAPAGGDVFSKVKTPTSIIEAAIEVVDVRGKSLVDIEVDLVDEELKLVSTFVFTWLLASEERSN